MQTNYANSYIFLQTPKTRLRKQTLLVDQQVLEPYFIVALVTVCDSLLSHS
jgi:hypothetical protein